MKNVEMNTILEIKELVENCKKYKSIYAHTEQMFDRENDYELSHNIFKALDNNIKDTLLSIDDCLREIYKDWAGISLLKKENYSNEDDYYITCETIDEIHELSGICKFLTSNNLDVQIDLPMDFIKEFIAEFGMFKLDKDNDVWVV